MYRIAEMNQRGEFWRAGSEGDWSEGDWSVFLRSLTLPARQNCIAILQSLTLALAENAPTAQCNPLVTRRPFKLFPQSLLSPASFIVQEKRSIRR